MKVLGLQMIYRSLGTSSHYSIFLYAVLSDSKYLHIRITVYRGVPPVDTSRQQILDTGWASSEVPETYTPLIAVITAVRAAPEQ